MLKLLFLVLLAISLSPAFLPLSLSVTRLREEEGERGGTPRFSEGKNNARYSWGNHLASNLFSLSLSLSLLLVLVMHTNVCDNGIWLIEAETNMKVKHKCPFLSPLQSCCCCWGKFNLFKFLYL